MKTRFIVDFDENENTKMGAVVLFGVLGVSGRLIEEFFPFFSVLCVYFLLRNVSDIEWILSSSYENVYESEWIFSYRFMEIEFLRFYSQQKVFLFIKLMKLKLIIEKGGK